MAATEGPGCEEPDGLQAPGGLGQPALLGTFPASGQLSPSRLGLSFKPRVSPVTLLITFLPAHEGVSNPGPTGEAVACDLCMYIPEGKKKLGEKCGTNRCKKPTNQLTY